MTTSATRLMSEAPTQNAGETTSMMRYTASLVGWCVNSIALLATAFFILGDEGTLSAMVVSLAPIAVMGATAALITAAALRQPVLAAASLGALLCSMLLANSAYGALNDEPWPTEHAAASSSATGSALPHLRDIGECERSCRRPSVRGLAGRY